LDSALVALERSPVTADRSPTITGDHRFFLTGLEYARAGMDSVHRSASESVHWLAIAKSVRVNTI
jgi:hypothetical protein